MGPMYPAMLRERFGMTAGADPVLVATADGGGPELPRAAEQFAQEVTLLGTHDEAPDSIAAWDAAGADGLHLVLAPGRPGEELLAVVDVAARAVRV